MNAPTRIAQVAGADGSKPTRILKIEKPQGGQAVTAEASYDGTIKIDFSAIANEKITLVHIGERLIILFDNQSTVAIIPFFDSMGVPLANITIESNGKEFTGAEFASTFPITTDQSVLPAAGDGTPASGANFANASVDPLLVPNPLPLLGPEELPPINVTRIEGPIDNFNAVPGAGPNDPVSIDEDDIDSAFSLGNGDDAPGDDDPISVSGVLSFTVGTAPTTVGFASMDGDTVEGVDGKGISGPLTSQGHDLVYVWDAGTNTLKAVWSDDTSHVVFQIEVNPTTGAYTLSLFDQLDHPYTDDPSTSADDATVTAFEDNLIVDLVYTVTDGNGDVATGTLAVDFDDDMPRVTGAVESRTVDEDDIETPWSRGTSPNDGDADGSITEDWSGAAFVSGTLAGLVDIGADEHPEESEGEEPEGEDQPPAIIGSGIIFSFTPDVVAQMEALGLYSKQSVQPATENGLPLFYTTGTSGDWQVLSAFEPDTPGPGDTGNPVFELRINQVTGAYEFRLFDELIHQLPPGFPSGSDQNFGLRSGEPDPITGQAIVDALDFGSIIQVTDYDGDSVTLDGKFLIHIRDDVPDPDIDLDRDESVIHDETPGDDGADDQSFNGLPSSARTAFTGVANAADDPDVPSTNLGAIGFAHDDDPIVFVDFGDSELGADHPPASQVFSLAIVGGNGTDSGLDITEGNSIFLYLEGNVIVGRVSGGPFDGQAAFAIHLNQNGEISVAQWLSIKHDDRGDFDESNDNGSNGNDAAPDDSPNPIQQTLAGKINAVLTITDSDGDSESDSVGVGDRIVFQDDGPKFKKLEARHDLTHDETPGNQSDAHDVDASGVPAAALAAFSIISNQGDDPHVPPASGPIGYAVTNGSVLDVEVSYGSDGQGAPIAYELVLDGNNLHSGLETTDGRDIHLFKEGNIIVGRYEVGGNNQPDGTGDEPAAFAIHIDPVTGQTTVVQYVSLRHPDTNSHDEEIDIDGGLLYVKVTAVDGDGDPLTDYVDIGSKIEFQDDGPAATFTLNSGISVIHDETVGVDGDANDVTPGSLANLFSSIGTKGNDPHDTTAPEPEIGYARSTGPIVTVSNVNFGADGPGSSGGVRYTIDVPGVSDDDESIPSGLFTTDGRAIYLFEEDGLVVGRYEDDNFNVNAPENNDPAAFAIHVDPTTGVVTVVQYVSLKHDDVNDHDEANDDGSEANDSGPVNDAAVQQWINNSALRLTVTVTDGDGDSTSQQFNIGNRVVFQDDGPALTAATLSGTVDEDGAFEGGSNNGGVGDGLAGGPDDVPGTATVTSGNVSTLFQSGVDGPLSYSLVDATSAQAALSGLGLTSGGAALNYAVSFAAGVYTLTASVPAGTVFTFAISSASGAWTFTLVDQLDHPSLDGLPGDNQENELAIPLGALVVGSDAEGDNVVGNANQIVITVDDDTPIALANAPVTLDEDDIPGKNGNPGGALDADPAGSPDHIFSGTLGFQTGADESASVSFASMHGTSQVVNGVTVSFAWNAAIQTLTANDGEENVFQVVVDNPTTGAFHIELLNSLRHHPDASVDDVETDATFALTYTVTDKDNDSITGSVSLTLDDDTPTMDRKICLVRGGADGADPSDLLYVLPPGEGLTVSVTDIIQDAAFQNSLGYYFADASGNPISGAILADHVGNPVDEDVLYTIAPDAVPAGAVLLGFFMIPNGNALNVNLADGDPITFSLVSDVWVASSSDGPLVSAQDRILFSDRRLNPDDSDGDTDPNDFERAVGERESNWEDIINGDNDFNDVMFNVEVCTKSNILVVVDEDGLAGHAVDGSPSLRPGEVDGSESVVAIGAAGALTALVLFGADGPHPTQAISLDVVTTPTPTGLTSQGGPVLIVSDGTTLTGYVEQAGGAGFQPGDRPIFTLTVTSAGGYTFTLLDQVDHPALDGEAGDDSENLLGVPLDLSAFIVAKDGDGDRISLAAGSFGVQILDDIPVVDIVDAPSEVNEGQTVHGTWTLAAGADDVTSVDISVGATTQTLQLLPPTGTVVFNLPEGTLTVDSDLQWHFTASAVSADAAVTFSIKATDGDGDFDTDSQTIQVINLNGPLTISGTVAGLVEEEHGIPGGIDDLTSAAPDVDFDVNGNLAITRNVQTGTFAASLAFDGDEGALGYSIANVATGTQVLKAGGGNLTSDEQNVQFHRVDANTLVGYVEQAGAGYNAAQDRTVFTLTLNQPNSGDYTFILHDNLDHHPDLTPDNVEGIIGINLDNRVLVTDNGDLGDDELVAKFTMNVIDDVPVAANDDHEVEVGAQSKIDLLLVVDVSQSMQTVVSGTGGQTRTDLARDALLQLVNNPNVDEVKIVRFRGASISTVWMDKAAAIAFINNAANFDESVIGTGGTNYDAALFTGTGSADNAFDTPPATLSDRYVFFLSDGEPTAGGGISATEEANWIGFLNGNNVVKSVAIGFGDLNATNENNLEPIAWQSPEVAGTHATAAADDNVIVIADDDLSGLGDILEGALNTADGNVLANDPGFGADGGYIKAIVVDGVTYTFNGVGTIAESGSTPAGYEDHGTWILVPTELGGELIFYFANTGANLAGDWQYTPPSSLPASDSESFQYTLVDGDGDTASAHLNIEVLLPPNDPPNTSDNAVNGLVEAVNTNNSSGVGGFSAGTASGAVNVLANDTDPGDTLRVSEITPQGGSASAVPNGGSVVVQGAYGTLTIHSNGTATYNLDNSLAATQALQTGQNVQDIFNYEVVDSGNLTDTAQITVNIAGANDAPVIWAPAAFEFVPGGTNDDNFHLNTIKFADVDSPGAVTVTLTNGNGDNGTFIAATGGGVTVAGSGTDNMTLTGTIAAINAFVAGNNLRYDMNGTSGENVIVAVNDGNGGTDTHTIAVNDNSVGSDGEDLPDANTFNVYSTLVDLGSGNDNLTTAWNHVGSAATEYEGGSGSDTIRVVFTPDQLNEILNNVSQQNALRTFLTTPSSDLNLDASSWNAIVDNFETANLGIAAPRETSGQDNYVNLDTWDPLPTAVAVGAGTGGNNLIVGTAAGQTLDGLGGNDVLAAFHTAANTLNGGSGSDLLLGGDGADILGGGDGMDILAGGKGADTFRASSTPGDANEDMLVDYGFAEGDTLDLSALLDSVFDVGDNVNNFIQVETVNTNDLVLRVDQTGTGNFGGKDVFLLAGAATNSGDPLRVFFDGTNHVVTG